MKLENLDIEDDPEIEALAEEAMNEEDEQMIVVTQKEIVPTH